MRNLINSLGNKLSLNVLMYYILNYTWGLLTTVIGYLLMLILLPFGKIKRFEHILYFEFKKQKGWGFSIGTVFFVGARSSMSIKLHEFGHTIQNAILGPFTIVLVYIPSAVRFWYRDYLFKHNKTPKYNYDHVWFEETASSIGNYYIRYKK